MADGKSKRIVFGASTEVMAALAGTSEALGLSKIATIRLAVAILSEIVREVSRGGKIVLRDADGRERELWLPQISVEKEP